MFKRHIILPCLLLFAIQANSQFALRDAIRMAPYFAVDPSNGVTFLVDTIPGSIDSVSKVLQWYANPNGEPLQNLFFSAELSPQANKAERMVFGAKQASILSAPAAASPFSAGMFAQGLAIFLAERAKEELAASFFREFQAKLQQNIIAQKLFPSTVATLKFVGDDEFYRLSQFITSLRENFRADLGVMPANLESALRDGDLIKKPEANILATDALHLTNLMISGETPMATLEYLSGPWAAMQDQGKLNTIQDEKLRDNLKRVATLLRTSNTLQESLRKSDTAAEWYTPAEIMMLFKNPVVANLYLGLLWEKSAGLDFGPAQNFRDLLETSRTNLFLLGEVKRKLLDFSADVTENVNTIKKLAEPEPDSVAAEQFFRYYNSGTKVLKTGFRMYQTAYKDDPAVQAAGEKLEGFFSISEGVSRLYQNLRIKNYPAVISTVVRVLDNLEVDNDQLKEFFRYANFMATVAQAQSPEEISHAIESFALPPGSARVKKTPKQRAFALNAYTGLSGGGEWQANRNAVRGFGSLSAPVGLSYTIGTDSGRYFGVFVPVIDVGALTVLRFSDDTSYDLPSLKWGNLISPGLYFVAGFKEKVPLAFGIGGQFGPSLRKVEVQGNQANPIQELGSWRIGAFLSVDIPVTYLHVGRK